MQMNKEGSYVELARRITQTEPGPVAGGGTSFQAGYQKPLLRLPGDGVQSEWGSWHCIGIWIESPSGVGWRRGEAMGVASGWLPM